MTLERGAGPTSGSNRHARSLLRGLVWVAVCLALAFVWARSRGVQLRSPERAPVATALPMRELDGAAVDLADFAGRVVVLNVWASWCGPCRAEIPAFGRVYADYREEGLEILGLNVDDLPAADVERISRDLGVRYPVTRVTAGFGGTFPDPDVIPHSWFIDRAGRVRGSHSGVLSEGALRRAVSRLLED